MEDAAKTHHGKPPWRQWRDTVSEEGEQPDASCAPFGTVLGIAFGGIPAYSSNYDNILDPTAYPDRTYFRNTNGDLFYGMKYQCVEFARRWLIHVMGITFTALNFAYEIFDLQHAIAVKDASPVLWTNIPNGSVSRPCRGDVLIWAEGGEFELTGHVAIVVDVSDEWVRIAEQNVEDVVWPTGRDWARELSVTVDAVTGGFTVLDTFGAGGTIRGWMRLDEGYSPKRIPLNQQDAAVVAAATESAEGLGEGRGTWPGLKQYTYTVPDKEFYQSNWLDFSIPASQVYREVEPFDSLSVPHVYYTMPQSVQEELGKASEELHVLFLQATAHVLDHPSYWDRFGFPEAFWSLAKNSFSRGDKALCGRFDFSVSTEHGMKCYEYNADSAACLFECAYTEDARMRALGLGEVGIDGGRCTAAQVIAAWKDYGMDEDAQGQVVHFIGGVKGYEETFHRDYMIYLASQAGVRCKHIVPEDLSFGAEGSILDKEGEQVRLLWKTWSYSTLLKWLEEEGPVRTSGDVVRIMDVCLSRDIKVIEPPWTAITANKAILPVLWELFPHCPYALESSLQLTDSLNSRMAGYVTKPVFGRCGDNVTLHIASAAEHIIGNMVEAAVQSTALDSPEPQKVSRMNSDELNKIFPVNTTLEVVSPDRVAAELPLGSYQDSYSDIEKSKEPVGPASETVATFSSHGRFDSSSVVYQELCPLPYIDGYFVQVNTFCADGKFSGSVLRVDRTAIIMSKSPIVPLRIVTVS